MTLVPATLVASLPAAPPMLSALPSAVDTLEATGPGIGTPLLWGLTIAGVVLLLALDFALTRRPHEVSMKEAAAWSSFYIAIPLAFGAWVWRNHGSEIGLEYYTGYLVEKSLSVDNLFIFMLLLAAFAVPRELQQRVLLIGVAGALVLRAIFIALGTQLLASFTWMFLIFGAVLLVTGVKVFRDTATGNEHEVDPSSMRSIALLRKVYPVVDDYRGPALTVIEKGRRHLTPLALVIVALIGTDIVFAIDSVPAVFGITGDPYLVFATNAFALLGLRALYFVLEGALSTLVHLGYGLGLILAFIGTKLVLHWAHGVWPSVPTVPTLASLVVIVVILATVVMISLHASRRARAIEPAELAESVESVELADR